MLFLQKYEMKASHVNKCQYLYFRHWELSHCEHQVTLGKTRMIILCLDDSEDKAHKAHRALVQWICSLLITRSRM